MVAILVVTIAVGVLQLALVLYVRNALISSAAEGARVAARAGANLDDGTARTRQLITDQLSAGYASDVRAGRSVADGVRVVEVTVSAPLPVIGMLGPSGALTITARAFDEVQ